MSRIGKKPVAIPNGVNVQQQGREIKVIGPLGQLTLDCHSKIKVNIDNKLNQIRLENTRVKARQSKELHGTMRALIANMVTGVTKGFEKKMELYGTGFGISEKSGKLVLQVGFSHPVELPIPKEIKVKIETPNTRGNDVPARFALSGIDKQKLGQFAANVRSIRPPEPYKGKGIRYADEYIRRKVGKTFASGSM